MLIFVFVVFIIADSVAYILAKYPERTSLWWMKLPGGGFYALLKYGKNKQ